MAEPTELESSRGEAMLAHTVAHAPLIALDFDGTLSTLVADPKAACIDPAIPPLLESLKTKVPIAIVSGRGLDDLMPRVPVEGLDFVGNHGNEWICATGPEAGIRHDPDPAISATVKRWVDALNPRIPSLDPGVLFEPKSLSVSIHFRHVQDPADSEARILELARALDPVPEIIEGKYVVNLMPPGLVTKYEAIARLAELHRRRHLIFVGDDVTDERAFARAPGEWLTVRVWDDEHSDRTGLVSSARSCVRHVRGVVALLTRLDRMLEASATQPPSRSNAPRS